MGRSSRFRSRCTSGLVAVLVLGCGPRVEENDDFIEQECAAWCDGATSCEGYPLSRDECFDICVNDNPWTDGCREPQAAYFDCLLGLSCEERDQRHEAAVAAEDLSGYACYEESYEASTCRND